MGGIGSEGLNMGGIGSEGLNMGGDEGGKG